MAAVPRSTPAPTWASPLDAKTFIPATWIASGSTSPTWKQGITPLVIRVNWDYSPDANGSYELNYANNAVAVCFSFERDADGNATNFAKYEDC